MCFFFSSRRRHTIWPRDWSSDVCSSDLRTTGVVHAQTAGQTFRGTHGNSAHHAVTQLLLNFEGEIFLGYSQRSEERRVGKECRAVWAPRAVQEHKRVREIEGGY